MDLQDINICLPAEIIEFDGTNATVKPALNKKLTDGSHLEAPLIYNVPVNMPIGCGGKAVISVPLQKGDPVLLVFTQRSIEGWKNGVNGTQDMARMFDLSDCTATPIGRPTIASFDTENVSVEFNNAHIKITPTGDIKIVGNKMDVEVNSLTVKGSATFENDVTVQGGATLNSGLNVSGGKGNSATITGSIKVTGSIQSDGNINAVGTVHGSNI